MKDQAEGGDVVISRCIKVLVDSFGISPRSGSEHDLTLGYFLLTEDEGLASLDDSERFGFALRAFKFEHDFLGVLGLLSEDWLGLSTETLLFHIISSLTLGDKGGFTRLVLGNFVGSVLLQLWAESSNSLWDMHHFAFSSCLTN